MKDLSVRTKIVIVISVVGFFLLRCSKDPQPLAYDIYVAGNDGGAVYWKNGVPTLLPGGAGCSGIVSSVRIFM